jgi:hypothetical protein
MHSLLTAPLKTPLTCASDSLGSGSRDPLALRGPTHLRGVTQQNDKAKLFALVLLVQAAVANAPHFPYGIVVCIDNKWVCDAATPFCLGTRLNPSIAQWKWWHKLATLLSAAPLGFLKSPLLPCHVSEKDVEKGVLTRHQYLLNCIADDLADQGAKRNAPLPRRETRVQVTMAIQKIIAASLSRKRKQEELADKLTRAASIPLPITCSTPAS